MEKAIYKQEPHAAINPIVSPKQDSWITRLLLNLYTRTHTPEVNSQFSKKSPFPLKSLLQNEKIENLIRAYALLTNPVILVDSRGKIRWVNKEFVRLLGYAPGGRKFSSLEKKKDKMISFASVIREKETLRYEYEGTANGKTYWLLFTLNPLPDKDNKTGLVLMVGSDITALKQREEELMFTNKIAEHSLRKGNKALDKLGKAKRETERFSKMKDRFFACMSHEIRTPMNGIVGIIELLQRTQLSEEQKEYLCTMKATGESLLVVINDILDLSKIEAGKIGLSEIPFLLPDVINDVTKVFQEEAKKKNITFRKEIDTELTWTLLGDPFRLSQVVMNLLSNAIKFTPRGEVFLSAKKLRETAETLTVEIAMQDTGIGIPKDKMNSLFSEFMQLHSSSASHYGGTGLGLAISKKLVEMQGGTIEAESKENEGSRFIVSLTYKKCTSAADLKKIPDSGLGTGTASENLTGISILLAEDNAVNQLVGQRLLNEAGASVEIAGNGKIAIEMLKKHRYDIVLMDIRMPEMDGYQVTQYIRNELEAPARAVPVIALTAYTGLGEIKKCMRSGMNDYISKPFKTHELCKKINKAVQHSQNRTLSETQKKEVHELH